MNYSETIARNLGSSPNGGGDIVYYERHKVGKGGGSAHTCGNTSTGALQVSIFAFQVTNKYWAFERRW